VSPSQCDVRRDDGELYDVHGGGEVQADDVSWARDALVQDGALLFDVLEQVLVRDLYHRAGLPSQERRELRRQEREP
jgi:chloramphenicol 3-O-phosphotransferase